MPEALERATVSVDEEDPHGTRGTTAWWPLDNRREVLRFSSADVVAAYKAARGDVSRRKEEATLRSALVESVSVDCLTLQYDVSAGCLPRLLIRTRATSITVAAVDALIEFSQRVLDRAEDYTVIWDLRHCCTPRAKPTWQCIQWAHRNKRKLDAQLRGIAIVLSGGALASVVRFVLGATRPPQPHLVCQEIDEALGFVARCR